MEYTLRDFEMTERTYGVEIEFYGVNYQKVVNELNLVGIETIYEGYNHTTRRHWKLVTDISVPADGTGVGKGLEIVSPILKGKEGLEELKAVLSVLNRLKAKVNRKCGVHVHHGISDYTLENFKNLFLFTINGRPYWMKCSR